MIKKLNKIVEMFRIKDYSKFDYFYDETKNIVYYALINIVKDNEVASDLMQDLYVKFINNIDKYKAETNIYSYLTVMAKNMAINEFNRRKREIIDNDYIDEIPSNDKESKGILELIEILDSDQREIVFYHIIQNLKFKEISLIVGKPLGTVLWLYNKALKTLKERLGEDFEY